MSVRGVVIVLFGVFAAPFVAAWSLYFNPGWLPAQRSNHGELVEPVVPVAGYPLIAPNRGRVVVGDFQGRWVLLLRTRRCQQRCRQTLWRLRQVRLALGADRRRLVRVLVLGHSPSPQLRQLLRRRYAGTQLFLPATEAGASALGEAGRIYVIDPQGNLMMRYPAEADGKAILEDMRRLMKISKYWGRYGSD